MAKARSLNKVMLIGNLTRDPSLKETGNGVKVCTFGIATNSMWKDAAGGVQEKAEFHNIVAFNKLAEICLQVLSVGMLVYVEGELRTRVKDDEETGKKIYRTEIKLNDMVLLNSKDKKGVGFVEGEDSDDDDDDKHSVVTIEEKPEVSEEVVADDSSDEEFDSKELF